MSTSLDSKQQAAADQFHKQAANYGRGHILADTADVAALLDLIPPPHEGAALDVATGGGHTALALARAGFAPVTLTDVAPAMLENAARLLAEEGFAAETALCPAEALPFPGGSFTLTACRVAPHHFSDVPAFLRESFRVLRPGGHVIIIDGSVPDGDLETAEWLHQVEKLRDPSHGRLLSRAEWTGGAEAAGFTVIHAELQEMVQPDLEWYFTAAATSEENRAAVRELLRTVSPQVRAAMKLIDDDGGPVRWKWQRLGMLARKNAV